MMSVMDFNVKHGAGGDQDKAGGAMDRMRRTYGKHGITIDGIHRMNDRIARSMDETHSDRSFRALDGAVGAIEVPEGGGRHRRFPARTAVLYESVVPDDSALSEPGTDPIGMNRNLSAMIKRQALHFIRMEKERVLQNFRNGTTDKLQTIGSLSTLYQIASYAGDLECMKSLWTVISNVRNSTFGIPHAFQFRDPTQMV